MKNKKFGFGTGALVAAAFIGPGTVTVCTSVGAEFGFQLIWVLVFSILATISLQEMVVRLTIMTRKDLSTTIRNEVQGKIQGYFISALVITAIYIGSVAYESGNIAGAAWALQGMTGDFKIHLSEALSIDGYGLIIGTLAAAILATGRYHIIEKILIALVILMSLVFIVTAIIVKPPLVELLKGFVPSLPDESMLLVVGLLGTTVVPYNLFLQSGALLNKSPFPSLKEAKNENSVSISLGGLISMAIVVTSSVMFFQSGIELQQVTDLAIQLQPVLGSWSGPFMTLGFFSAGISSALTAPLAAAFTVSGILGWKGGMKDWRFRVVWLSAVVFGVIFFSTGIKPLKLIIIAQFANGLLLPVVAFILLALMNKKSLLGPSKNNLKQNIAGLAVVIITAILGLRSLLTVIGVL